MGSPDEQLLKQQEYNTLSTAREEGWHNGVYVPDAGSRYARMGELEQQWAAEQARLQNMNPAPAYQYTPPPTIYIQPQLTNSRPDPQTYAQMQPYQQSSAPFSMPNINPYGLNRGNLYSNDISNTLMNNFKVNNDG